MLRLLVVHTSGLQMFPLLLFIYFYFKHILHLLRFLTRVVLHIIGKLHIGIYGVFPHNICIFLLLAVVAMLPRNSTLDSLRDCPLSTILPILLSVVDGVSEG
jgi:hypothetical protein